MRTRRSWRNQKRLWHYLTPQAPAKPECVPHTREEIMAMYWLGKTSRNLMLRDLEKRARAEVLSNPKIERRAASAV